MKYTYKLSIIVQDHSILTLSFQFPIGAIGALTFLIYIYLSYKVYRHKVKLKAKKYNPSTRKHEMFVEKKLPPHSK